MCLNSSEKTNADYIGIQYCGNINFALELLTSKSKSVFLQTIQYFNKFKCCIVRAIFYFNNTNNSRDVANIGGTIRNKFNVDSFLKFNIR